MYLSGTTTEFFKDGDTYGCMFNTKQKIGKENKALEASCTFGIDNGVFSAPFNERQWLTRLWDFWPYRKNCIVCALPDYLHYFPDGSVIGDWRKTLDRFNEYKNVPIRMGFPVTLVTQDGLMPNNVPWHELDAIFIGGSNYHKRGLEAENLAMAALKRGLHIHVGRVSVPSTAILYWPWADTYDGTTFKYNPDEKFEKYTSQWKRLFNMKYKPHQRKLF